MGEVYRVRDPRLDRDVAIKILPASFAADPDRVRTALGIDDCTYLEVTEHEDEIRSPSIPIFRQYGFQVVGLAP